MISRVVGTEPVDDAITFFRAFEGMEEGFRDRAAQVMRLLASDDTAFVLVTSPRRDAVEEAEFFAARLADGQFAVDVLVVNRMHRRYTDDDPDALRARARELVAEHDGAATRLAAHYANLADFEEIAVRERAELTGLEQRIGNASVAHVPELGYDVHDFTALRAVGAHLMSAG